jgi:hypothetical protein
MSSLFIKEGLSDLQTGIRAGLLNWTEPKTTKSNRTVAPCQYERTKVRHG